MWYARGPPSLCRGHLYPETDAFLRYACSVMTASAAAATAARMAPSGSRVDVGITIAGGVSPAAAAPVRAAAAFSAPAFSAPAPAASVPGVASQVCVDPSQGVCQPFGHTSPQASPS